MKKIYLSLFAMGLAGAGFAQQADSPTSHLPQFPTQLSESTERVEFAPSFERGGGAIWTEDFDNGLNSDNGMWTVGGPNGDVWDHVTEIAPGCYTTGAQSNVDFPTMDNGFMVYHADSVNCVDASTNPPVITEDPISGELISPSIDLSEYSAVSISFHHLFRHCCQGLQVLLSVTNDGGENWTDYDVTFDTQANDYNTNTTHQVNISSVAAGEDAVQFKFTWNAGATSSHYFWAIDDIELFVPVDYDLGIANASYSGFDINNSPNYADLPYSIYPLSQLRPLTFQATATNFGAMEQDDVVLQVTITDEDGAEVDVISSEPVTLESGEAQTIMISGYDLPTDIGEYTVSFELISGAEDFNPDDNVGADASFRISEAEYARDRYSRTGEFTNFDDNYLLGNMFYIENDVEVYCLGAALSTSSVPGTFFAIEVRADDLDGYITETEGMIVPSADSLNATGEGIFVWEWILGGAPFNAVGGSDIFVGLSHYGGDDDVVLATSGQSIAQTSFFYEGSEDTWYYVTSTPMVRMGLSAEFCSVVTSIETPEQVTNHNLYPNPVVSETTLEYSLLETANVKLMVFDNMGRIVMEENKGKQPVGEYRFNYDFSHLSSGMYTFSILVDDKAVNKKLIVK